MPQMMEVIKIPKKFKKEIREQIADDVIEFIIERTSNGIDKYGDDFPEYTEAYAKKKGVSVQAVDLVASGEMILSQQLKKLRDAPGEIVIGYDGRSKKLNAKVEGNITGSYGGDPDKKKARDFLGISRKDLMDIISQYESDEGDDGDDGE